MRVKETEADYRFFPEPDIPPFLLKTEVIERLRDQIPELPMAKIERLVGQYGITKQDAAVLCSDLALSAFFEEAAEKTSYHKLLSNLIQTDLLRLKGEGDSFTSPVTARHLADLCTLLGERTINSSTAKKLLTRLSKADFDPAQTVKEEGLEQICDPERLRALVMETMQTNPKAVSDYQNGKHAALRALEGMAMARVGGKADPVLLEKLFLEALSKSVRKGE